MNDSDIIKDPRLMTIKEQTDECHSIMKFLADKYFGGRCHITLKECEDGKKFAIHHKEEWDGDVLARVYRKKYGERYRIYYLRDLKKQFETDPSLVKRTVLIQNYVHTRIDHYRNGIAKFPMDQRKRFCDLVMATKTEGRKGRLKK